MNSSGWPVGRRLFAALLTVWLFPAAAGAVDVLEPYRWGFDGKVVLHRFNPLSFQVINNSSAPYEGDIVLQSGGFVGEAIREPLYLPPQGVRWVQLYPFVQEDGEDWRVTFVSGRQRQSFRVDEPKSDKPALVFLAPVNRLSASAQGLSMMPENLFPPMVTATDGLRAVVLGHVPQWDQPRQQAFLDWVERGGTVHLMHDPSGAYPVFKDLLTPLNGAAGQQLASTIAVGSGRVVRHPENPRQINKAYVAANFTPAPGGKRLDQQSYYTNYSSIDQGVMQHLKDMTKPEHNWVLIYFLSILYLLLFPGVYLLGRRRVHFGLVYAALLLGVAVFSLGFHQVGKRGYGEATAVHSVALARSIEPGVYDVTQWSHVFVTDGGDYLIKHKASSVLYSTGQRFEMIRGHVINGPGAELKVDIPPFSGRGVVHRMKVAGPKLSAKLLTIQPTPEEFRARTPPAATPSQPEPPGMPGSIDAPQAMPYAPPPNPFINELTALEVQFEGDAKVVQSPVYAMYRNGVYELTSSGDGKWRLASPQGGLVNFFQCQEFHSYVSNSGMTWGYRPNYSTEQLFNNVLRPAMQKTLFAEKIEDLPTVMLEDDRVRLLFTSEIPPAFFIDDKSFGKQGGRVVYSMDVPIEGASEARTP